MTALKGPEPQFSMSACYDRTAIMRAQPSLEEYQRLGTEVKKKLFRDVCPPEKQDEWWKEDAKITAELERLAETPPGDSIAPHNSPLKYREIIRGLDLEVFARTAPKFAGLLDLVERRLGGLPAGGFEPHEVELVRCCTCGPGCWKISCNFSIRRKGPNNTPFTIPIEIKTGEGKDHIPRSLQVKVFVSVAFTCSDKDYEVIFRNAALAPAQGIQGGSPSAGVPRAPSL